MGIKKMKKERGFTLIELLVVIAIIAVLLAILMPSLRKAKVAAQAVVCLSNLKQWNILLNFFLDDNDGRFPSANYGGGGNDPHGQWWIQPLKTYNENPKILICAKAKVHPKASRNPDHRRNPQAPDECWGSLDRDPAPTAGEWTWGSYAPNAWMMDTKDGFWRNDAPYNIEGNYWGKRANVLSPYEVPLFLDSRWVDVWPTGDDAPDDLEWNGTGGTGYMQQLCVTRHGLSTGIVFMDGSSRRVPLTGLWGLKWYKNFDMNNDYNTGVEPFPDWMD